MEKKGSRTTKKVTSKASKTTKAGAKIYKCDTCGLVTTETFAILGK